MKKPQAPSHQMSLLPTDDRSEPTARAILAQTVREIIRVESVLSKLPMHCLSKQGAEPIHIQRNLPSGKVDLLWDVSPTLKYGMPGIMAYQIDTLIINKRMDEAGRPMPMILRLGTMRSICQELGLRPSGTLNEQIRKALYQCAGAMITAKLTYTTNKGQTKRLEAGFRRYDVIFTGEQLPDGQEADAVYIIPGQVYAGLLNEVPVRPLDFSYLKAIPSPSAQRWYEVASFKVYAALRNGQESCWLDYSEYCLASGQKRYELAVPMQKQMYKIHRTHLQSGYILNVRYESLLDRDDIRDWRIWYTIGPRAVAEYQEFNRVRREPESLPDSKTLPSGAGEAELLVKHFLHLRFGSVRRDPSRKEIAMAENLILDLGYETAQELIATALTQAAQDNFSPLWMNGLERHCEDILSVRQNGSPMAAGRKEKKQGNSLVGEYRAAPQDLERAQKDFALHAFEYAYDHYLKTETEAYVRTTYTAAQIEELQLEKKKYWRKRYAAMDEAEIERAAYRSVFKEFGAQATLMTFEEFQEKNATHADEIIAAYSRQLGLEDHPREQLSQSV